MTRHLLPVLVLFVSTIASCPASGLGQEPAPATPRQTDIDFFETHVRPVLANHCYKCHGPDTQERELRLDRLSDLQQGGASGPSIVPGQPGSSLLITAVQYVDDDLQMPPDGKLKAEEIAALIRWIELGAPHPDARDNDPAKSTEPRGPESASMLDHWAFRAPVRPALPCVKGGEWVCSPIDVFVLAKLESEGITPAATADQGTLIRRATLDLTGLPPTPAELQAFLDDGSPLAYAQLIDRLLGSPRYGERWGRHWLDVVRYADSNGLDENVAYGNAWRYRDYVIASLNRGKPFDQFVREQVAGDLLSADAAELRNEQLIATGFLALGPKVLAEVDERKMEMDIVDEQVDTVGRSLMGLTLGCARCHDHKFDPIRTQDYYALAGIFKSTHTMESFTKIARWHENPLSSQQFERAKEEHAQQLAALKRSLAKQLATAKAQLPSQPGQDLLSPAELEPLFPQATRDGLQKLREQMALLEKHPPAPPAAMGVCEGDPTDVAVHVRGSHLTLGERVPRSVLRMVSAGPHSPTIDAQHSGRLELAEWLTRPDHPLLARVMVNRVWRWHFGRGLVETTDNFGKVGARPENPELLDWLAVEFIHSGWSIKYLHRLIMSSATYRMGSTVAEDAARRDPGNRLLSRATARRMEAEELRDSVLFVAGSLDDTMGGTMLTTANRTHIFDHTSKDDTVYASQRRSVYLPVIRNHLHDVFTLFDYTDASVPNGHRPTSTVPAQALYLMNSGFLAEAAKGLADRVWQRPGDDDAQRIHALYQIALGRQALPTEIEQAMAYLQRFAQDVSPASATAYSDGQSAEAWRLLCQVILMSNEFCYVR